MVKEKQVTKNNSPLIADIKLILAKARQKAYSAVNSAMVEAHWQIGKRIVEEEQQGKERANYGEEILKALSIELTKEFGKGFGERNLRDFRQFYLTFQDKKIWHTLCAKLSWSHIRLIMRVENKDAQKYYLKETAENHWSVRTLDRNISTLYYQRLLSSQIKEPLVKGMYDDLKKTKEDNPTIGLLLCTETDKTIAKYSVLSENKQLFASKYLSYLPTEEELAMEIERQKILFKISSS